MDKKILKIIYLKNKTIAEKLGLSTSTVKTYVYRLETKYKCKNKLELLIKSIQMKIIDVNNVET